MLWLVGGVVYSLAYVVVVWAASAHPEARLWIANFVLPVSPIPPILVILRRRGDWVGHQRVFWSTIAIGCGLWLAGAITWTVHELILHELTPWLDWHTVLQLVGTLLTLLALISRPEQGPRARVAATAALDIAGVAFVAAFLYWAIIITPALALHHRVVGAVALAVFGIAVRVAAALAFAWAATRAASPLWAQVHRRLSLAAALGAVLLVPNAVAVASDTYGTGAWGDVGWILPFWLIAWAASDAPRSEPDRPPRIGAARRAGFPALLFAALAVVAVVGYWTRNLLHIDDPIDAGREFGAMLTLLGGIGAVMLRLRLERRETADADARVRLLAAACEQATEIVIIVEQDRIEYANDAFCRATGYSREDLEHLAADAVITAEETGPGPMAAARQARMAMRGACRVRRRDGTSFPGECALAPVVGDDRQIAFFVGVVRDLTDETRLRDQLVRSERLSAVGELAAGVAHEINNPLQSLVGTVDVLLHSGAAQALHPDLERVRAEANRAGRIAKNLLAFVRRSPKDRLLADLNETVGSTVALRAYELTTAGIHLQEDYATNLPVILVNRDEIQQILINLILNAEQAMKPRGSGVLTVRTLLAGCDAVVEIADDGPGVAPAARARIFEPFFTTREFDTEATGLGLSIAFGIAAAHGGALELLPTTSGACFRLTLPGAGFPGPAHFH